MSENESDIQKQQSQEEDFEVIRQVLDGNTAAYDKLQIKYRRVIASLIRRMVRDEDDVDDLVQESFIKAYRALPGFRFGYSFSAWLYRISSNTCIDFLRKKRLATVSINRPIPAGDEDHYLDIEDQSYMPDLDVLSRERKKVLNKAIDDLPENYRVIIKLRHEEELDYKDIALKLDIPLGTVKAHLFRARKVLLQNLKKDLALFKDQL